MQTKPGSPLLKLQNLQISYGGIQAVKGIDLELWAGELVCLIGANGAGKSSTLKAICGLVPRSGSVSYGGADTAGINDSAGSAAASLKETTEDLKYMRDLAEQEAINRFTTAEVKIDMTGMTNRIDSDMDLDGVLNTLTEGFAEALEVAAEGVHE